MGNVQTEVTDVINGAAELVKGLAAKNQTMKDGPPESGGGDSGGTRPRTPDEQGEQGAYDKYKETISEIHRRHGNAGNPDNVAMGLEIGQAIVDLAMDGGGDVLKLFGDLLK